MLLNIDSEWRRIGGERLPYYGAGWAYITDDEGKKLVDKIEKTEQSLSL